MKARLPWYLDPPSTDLKKGCVVLFTLPFLAGGLLCLWYVCLQPTLNWWNARGWERTDAVIEESRLEEDDDDGDTYKVAVKFRYRRDGVSHVGTRHSFVSGSTNVGVKGMRQTVGIMHLRKG